MTSLDDSGDTVVSSRRAAAGDDTVLSKRVEPDPLAQQIAADTAQRPVADETTDHTVVSRRRTVHDIADSPAADTPAGGGDQFGPRRQAYAPDAEALRAPAPARVTGPVLVPRRSRAADPVQGTVRESVDRASTAARTPARWQVLWLVSACAAVAATAAALLILFLPL